MWRLCRDQASVTARRPHLIERVSTAPSSPICLTPPPSPLHRRHHIVYGLTGSQLWSALLTVLSYSGFISFLGLDIQHFRSLTIETCCRTCVYQRVFASWEILPPCESQAFFVTRRSPPLALALSRQVYMAKVLGPTYVHSYVICISTNVLCIAMCFILRQVLSNGNKDLQERESSGGRL